VPNINPASEEEIMATQALSKTDVSPPVFPEEEVRRRLQLELKGIAEQSSVIRPEWEPLLDSKRVVGTVLVLEDLFPFKVPPDKVVRKGGYQTVADALDDMVSRVKRIWDDKSRTKVGK
jgi:hypothetical protein